MKAIDFINDKQYDILDDGSHLANQIDKIISYVLEDKPEKTTIIPCIDGGNREKGFLLYYPNNDPSHAKKEAEEVVFYAKFDFLDRSKYPHVEHHCETVEEFEKYLNDAISSNQLIIKADIPMKSRCGFVCFGNKQSNYYTINLSEIKRSKYTDSVSKVI